MKPSPMSLSLLPLLAGVSGAARPPQAGAPQAAPEGVLDSRIVSVTVYPGGAAVRREAALPPLPSGGGTFVLAGLPASLDPDALQVRIAGAELVAVEVRDGVRANAAEARVADLRSAALGLERELQALRDERAVLKQMEEHLGRLLLQEEGSHAGEVSAGRADLVVWERNYGYLHGKLAALRTETRELTWREEELALALRERQLELGRCEASADVRVRDVVLEVVDTSGRPAALELEYVVGEAGWAPHYDLRASKALTGVELVYRAKVWQHSGEDWRDVEVQLSTAQARRGARGPEPRPIWLSLARPRAARDGEQLRSLGYAAHGDDDAGEGASVARAELPAEEALFAWVSAEGLSVRYHLARRETIESRLSPSSVLVGRAELATVVEHHCVPALDTAVWLRGRAQNTSPWVLLPGRAAVYFGADFVGYADLGAVQRDQEFELFLGPDPGLEVERVRLVDRIEEPGLFGSRETHREAWRLRVKNHGACSTRADGSVDVIVQEVLPRSKDERIAVELSSAKPAPSEDPRWKRQRTEQGVLAWVLPVERGREALVQFTTEVVYPEGQLIARGE